MNDTVQDSDIEAISWAVRWGGDHKRIKSMIDREKWIQPIISTLNSTYDNETENLLCTMRYGMIHGGRNQWVDREGNVVNQDVIPVIGLRN